MKPWGIRHLAVGFALVCAITVAALTPRLWQEADAYMLDQKAQIVRWVEDQIGLKLVYSSVAPNFLEALEFLNVQALAANGEPVLKAASVRFRWNWTALWSGNIDQLIGKIQVINATVDLREARDAALLARLRQALAQSGSSSTTGLQVEGFNVAARWSSATETIAVDRGFVQFFRVENDYQVVFRGGLTAQFLAKNALIRGAVGQLDGSLRASPDFSVFSLQARTSQVKTNLFSLAPLNVQLKVNPHSFEIIKVQDNLPVDFRLHWDPLTGALHLAATTDHFQPSRILTWNGSSLLSNLLSTTVTGNFALDVDPDGRSWTATLAGEAGFLPGLQESGPLKDSSVLTGEIRATPQVIEFKQTRFDSPQLGLTFDGTLATASWLPDGRISVSHWDDPAWGTVAGDLEFHRTGTTAEFSGAGLRWGDLEFAAASGWIEHNGDLLAGAIDALHDQNGSSTRLVLGTKTSLASGAFPVTFQVTDLPVSLAVHAGALLGLEVGLPQEIQDLHVSTNGSLHLSPVGMDFLGLDAQVNDPGHSQRSASFSADVQNGQLRLKNGKFRWDSIDWTADAQLDWTLDRVVTWQLQAGVWGQKFEVTGLYALDAQRLSFSGSHGLGGTFQQESETDWVAQVKVDELTAPGGWKTSWDLQAEWRTGALKLLANKLEVEGEYPWNGEAFLVQTRGQVLTANGLSGQGLAGQATFPSVVLKDSHNRLEGSWSTTWDLSLAQPWVGKLQVKGVDGSETVALDWNFQNSNQGTLAVAANRLDLSRWTGVPLQGRLALQGNLLWLGEASTWDASATVSEAHWGESPLGVKMTAKGTLSSVAVSQIQAAVDPIVVQDASLNVDWKARTWSGIFPSSLRFGSTRWSGTLTNSGTWSPGTRSLSAQTELHARTVSVSGVASDNWDLSAALHEGLWNASLADNSLEIHGDLDGRVLATARSPFPLQGQISGTVAGGRIDLLLRETQLDLMLVKGLADKRVMNLKSGLLRGDFQIVGPVGDPEIRGKGLMTNVVGDSNFIRGTVGPVVVPIEFQGRSLKIPSVNIGPGSQTWMLSGTAVLDHLIPQDYLFVIETDLLSTIPFAYSGNNVIAKGNATGLLTIHGNPAFVVIGGKLVVQDTIVRLGATDRFSFGPEFFGINSDITFISGRNVTFIWPNETVPLLQAVMKTNQQVFIHWNEVINDFSFVGKVEFKTGEVNYLNQIFTLREGILTFKEDEYLFDPRLTFKADVKKRDDTGPVTITLGIDGPLSKFSPKFESQPYRTAEQLQQLIGATLAPSAVYTQSTSAATAISLAAEVGTGILLKPFEDQVKKNFHLDLFTVKTEILKNSLLREKTVLDASGYLDNTRLYFGKYLGDDLFLQGSVAFRQDSALVQQQNSSLLVEPELSMDFQTPFFLLNWTLQPQHPETLFVADNTVTFKWNWSY